MARRAAVAALLGTLLAACSIIRLGSPATIDLNTADTSALADLPGLTAEDRVRIVANRPYLSKEDLLRRNVVGEREYAAIADRVYVGPPGMPDYLQSVPPVPKGP